MRDTDSDLSSLIVGVCRAHRARANTLFAPFGLHAGQETVLNLLHEEDGLTLSQLAERSGVQPPTVTRMARRMGKHGLLRRRPCAEDGRAFRIYLTDAGRAAKGRVDAAWTELEADALRGLSEEEQDSLRSLLTRVHTNLSAV